MSKHDSPVSRNSLVDMLAVWLEENGYMVATCLEEQEYQKPPPLNGHKPDVYALKRGSPSVIGIVELCDRLRDQLTQQRWSALFAATTRPVSHPGSELYIENESIPLDPSGAFEYVLKLERGLNMVVVEAVDAAGNSTYRSQYVRARY